MCGINGSSESSTERVANMNKSIRHRGPDDTGVFSSSAFTIGNNRLAIIDLSPLGHQPMVSDDKRFAVAFNGEIYNFKELRKELKSSGAIFTSDSDTEVILQGYIRWGDAVTKRLRGMWGLAILDTKENKLFLSRDPFGIKPLYLYDDGITIAFSSEIRGLLGNEKINRTIDSEAVRQIILLGYAIAPRTILKDAKAILPGEEITIDLKTRKTFSKINCFETDQNLPPSDKKLEDVLVDSLTHHLIADVPVGLFFSGGTDSTVLGTLLKKLGVSMSAYHLAVSGRNDTPYAEAIAKELQLPLVSIPFEASSIKNNLKQVFAALDQPIADTSMLPTLLISQRAKQDVKVVLSGEGGDELFGGYVRHRALSSLPLLSKKSKISIPLHYLLTHLPSFIHLYPQVQGLIRLLGSVNKDSLERYLGETAFGKPFDHLDTIYNTLRARIELQEHPDDILALDRLVYLPDNLLLKIDTATMSQSIEGRVPFLDREVWRQVGAASLHWKRAGGLGKAPLKRILREYLPTNLVDRPKTGFSVSVGSLLQNSNLEESIEWYTKTFQGLIPAYDSVLTWGFNNHRDLLSKNIGYSMYATVILHNWLAQHNLSL